MRPSININGNLIDLSTPLVMGIVNITPDSFFQESRKQSESEIVNRVRQILEEGGRIIDIGGQSTSPTSSLIPATEEFNRLEPALRIIRKEFPDAILSVDTFYSEVAKPAVEKYGVNIINDISGGQIDGKMFDTVARLNVPYILMHMRGTPQTMQQHTGYDNLIQEILYYFSERIAKLNLLGVNDIIIDPGFGFSKTMDQNYQLMAYLKYFNIFEVPILAGISRKSMIYKLLECSPQESLNGTTVLNTVALLSGAAILRVHDVKEAVECVKIAKKISNSVICSNTLE
ncbi:MULTISPECIES: dihydropteroate synthase [Petrimonas]|jgi:dihydropteroate synthase|uniref:dihydropteroate synthase n=1 Tax=Petrimonas mucosa TaxID=1642646 RepID=A0A1G4GBG7_9BACT|nr:MULTISPECIES: dihydropteroate synthase [Petrimonas]MDD3870123.1 dihydropteroate synthase [Candidatus Cloacimonadota bacterium]SFU65652.1 dihydropteroate synthase [Porphyromonadaceae bacterium KHP3R9]MDD3560744.1 dihydropteroate synthase [Petrimonas mucosa]SCM59859.1 Dihydropteroate synthase {ECO:0000303/PubMed:1522070} [Petrimonas mucosa]HHT29945.1 dihydropteroate synthase [Petrimonas mucosa]